MILVQVQVAASSVRFLAPSRVLTRRFVLLFLFPALVRCGAVDTRLVELSVFFRPVSLASFKSFAWLLFFWAAGSPRPLSSLLATPEL